jgi:hypothetical protein
VNEVAADYCQSMVNFAPAHNQLDMARELNFASPVPATGDHLATFIGAPLAASFGVLGCGHTEVTGWPSSSLPSARAARPAREKRSGPPPPVGRDGPQGFLSQPHRESPAHPPLL